MTKVKICGITNLEDARLSVRFGADALGFNFYAKSPRFVTPEKAAEIIAELPPKVLKVGVFVNETLERVAEIAEVATLDALQLHGEEPPEYARELKSKTGLEIIKAFRVSPEFKPEDVLAYEVDAILLDAYSPKEHGGTGETFDWEVAKKVREIFPKMYLAGGLGPENIGGAIKTVSPFAVDACSGVERKKGRKDRRKLYEFFEMANGNFATEVRDIYDLLFNLEKHPVMYIRRKSIVHLIVFLTGLAHMQTLFGDGDRKFDWRRFGSYHLRTSQEDFRGWVVRKLLNQNHSNYDWATIIVNHCDGDEEAAFDEFFVLLEQFKEECEK